MAYTVEISYYSLTPKHIGEPLGLPPIVRKHGNPEDAMRDLFKSIGENEGSIAGVGQRFVIVDPAGKMHALDELYMQTFGESPIYRDNREHRYPKLTRGRLRV